MREQDVIQSILEKALLDAHGIHSPRIKRLNLVKGDLFELDDASILHYWKKISPGTPAQHAELHFLRVTGEVQCMACFQRYPPEGSEIHCPYCGSYGAKILSGEEFYLDSIETDHG